MEKFKLLLLGSCLTLGTTLWAQVPSHTQYVKLSDDEEKFYEDYPKWEPGKPLSDNPEFQENEEFYISRVKPKERFTNAKTQVDETMNPARKCLFWVPIGESRWNAIPNYYFNSEVFNMWSYVDHYGNWTAPIVRLPGAFADICHKNGVQTSTVGAIAFGASLDANTEPHGKNINALANGGYEKYLKYLRYYGVDGIGFNSEFYWKDSNLFWKFNNMIADSWLHKDEYGIPLTFAWYSLTGNDGLGMPTWDVLSDKNDQWFHSKTKNAPISDSFFLNYNWNATYLQQSVNTATSHGRSSFDVYAGMNMQGSSFVDWKTLKNYDISVGLWGAHNMNMLYESRGEQGSSPEVAQQTYLTRSERFFTGGSKNPVNTPEISNFLSYSVEGAKNFHGISSFVTARSALQSTDLAKEPFVTYFNLGNGKSFNFEGKTTFAKEWYNIGTQDYLPTWRWWFTSEFMGKTADKVAAQGLSATFTWDDAWYGGSSMKVSGTTEKEFLQLFKTKYPVKAGDELTIRYKVAKGNVNMRWACSVEGAESTPVFANIKTNADKFDLDTWIVKTVKIGSGLRDLKIADKTLAMIGLEFTNSEDAEILFGQVSLTRGTSVKPVTPAIKLAKILAYNYQGVDVKVVFSMGETPADQPERTIYNSDVNTWYYKIYVQQEGGEMQLCTTTTSWAAYVIGANAKDGAKVRIGVAAVSLDGKTDSEISWSDYFDLPEASIIEGIELDKPVIKANEEFTIGYSDPNHAAAKKWDILNAETRLTVKSQADGTSFTTSLEKEGLYDLALTFANEAGKDTTVTSRGLIQISSPEVGAVPQIKEAKINNVADQDVETEVNTPVTYSYVGREADGTVSRGLSLPSKGFGMEAAQLNFNDQTKFSIAFWFKANRFDHGVEGTHLLNIRSKSDGWPSSDWGYLWNDIMTDNTMQAVIKSAGNDHSQFRDPDFVLEPGRWYHMCLVMDYDAGRIVTLYLNGRHLGTNPKFTNAYRWKQDNMLLVGGYAANRSGLNGMVDEFQIYDKALTAEEAANTMKHQTVIPDNLIGYWDFETDTNDQNQFNSTGTNKALIAALYDVSSASEGDNQFVTLPASFDAGAPFIPGQFQVKTTPEWSFDKKKSTTSEEEFNSTSGNIKVSYSEAGDYTATLTLKNSWAEDSKTFNFVKIMGSPDNIDNIEDNDITVAGNPFKDELNLQFVNAGSYQIEVYNITGSKISSQAIAAQSGDFVRVAVNAPSGTYLVKILQTGKVVKTLKVIKE